MDAITRKCSVCEKTKPVDDFYWKVRGKSRQPHCKECHREYVRRYYRTRPADYVRWAAARKKKNRADAKERLAVLQAEPCMDCKNRFPVCAMQYDHVRGEKSDNVSTMVAEGREWSVIETEIAKCELVCANCHAIRTMERRVKH